MVNESVQNAYIISAVIIIALFILFVYVFTSPPPATVTTTTKPKTTISTAPTTTINLTTTVITNISSVPITIYNNQSYALDVPFQQMIVVNSSEYSQYINTSWDNVEFSTGQGGTGTILQAWVESNATNQADYTLVWVRMPNGLRNGTTRIYMDFMKSPVMSGSGPTGEAPQLLCPDLNDTQSCSLYGKYDNGAKVFNFYDNFAGASLNTAIWASPYGSSATYNIHNGISLSQEPEEGSLVKPLIYSKSYSVGMSGGIVDFYGITNITGITGDIDNLAGIGIVNASHDNASIAVIGAVGVYPGIFGLVVMNSSGVVDGTEGLIVPDPTYSSYSISIPQSPYPGAQPVHVSATQGYSPYYSVTMDTGLPSMPQQIGFIEQTYAGRLGPVLWIRERTYTPLAAMPTVSFGKVS